jgi:hypothetical protein
MLVSRTGAAFLLTLLALRLLNGLVPHQKLVSLAVFGCLWGVAIWLSVRAVSRSSRLRLLGSAVGWSAAWSLLGLLSDVLKQEGEPITLLLQQACRDPSGSVVGNWVLSGLVGGFASISCLKSTTAGLLYSESVRPMEATVIMTWVLAMMLLGSNICPTSAPRLFLGLVGFTATLVMVGCAVLDERNTSLV